MRLLSGARALCRAHIAPQASRRSSSRPATAPRTACFHSRSFAAAAASHTMDETEKYLFDLHGYLIVPQVFSPQEVAAVHAAIDANKGGFKERTGALRLGGSEPSMAGDGVTGREDLGGILSWKVDGPAGGALRNMLAHPRLQTYYNELCGTGYRLDHSPFILQQKPGADGFIMHGGAYDEQGRFDYELSYSCHNGRIRCNLLAASLQLTDSKEGDGGFVILPGSHKANFASPAAVREHRIAKERCIQPAARAGDVILFTEAATHGTLAWKGTVTRRLALYRFAPATVAYGRAYLARGEDMWPPEFCEGLTEAQRAVMQPPFNARLDRHAPAEDGSAVTVPVPRAGFKKDFDRSVFGTTYF